MTKRLATYQPEFWVELRKRVPRSARNSLAPHNDAVIDYALAKAKDADRTKQSKLVMEARKVFLS